MISGMSLCMLSYSVVAALWIQIILLLIVDSINSLIRVDLELVSLILNSLYIFTRSTIRDKIIPHAVSWFTGEAAQDDDFEGLIDGDEDDEEEDDEDEDEEDEESGDDYDTKVCKPCLLRRNSILMRYLAPEYIS